MIIQALFIMWYMLFSNAFQAVAALAAVNLTTDTLHVIGEFCGIASWIVGADLLYLIGGCIVFWFTVKITVGILLFVWRLLPFT